MLDPVLSSRRTADAIGRRRSHRWRATLQDFTLHWVSGHRAHQSRDGLPVRRRRARRRWRAWISRAAEAWIIQAMDTYDREGLYRGSAVFKNIDEFAARSG